MPGSMSRRLRPISSSDARRRLCISGMRVAARSSSPSRSVELAGAELRTQAFAASGWAPRAPPSRRPPACGGRAGAADREAAPSARASARGAPLARRPRATMPTAISTRLADHRLDHRARRTRPPVKRGRFAPSGTATGQPGEAAGDLGLPDAGRDPIIRISLLCRRQSSLPAELAAPQPVPQGVATARFARCLPDHVLSSSATICRGLGDDNKASGGKLLSAGMCDGFVCP